MVVVYSRNQVPIRLTEERWKHICERHPEMETQRARVLKPSNRRIASSKVISVNCSQYDITSKRH